MLSRFIQKCLRRALSKKITSLLLCLAVLTPAGGQYQRVTGTEPVIKAILYHSDNARALIHYNNQRFHVADKMRLDHEWYVEEIRRTSILFKRQSNNRFAEIHLYPRPKARFHQNWSLFGHSISLWDAIEILAHGFGYQAIMHFQAGGSVEPGNHATNVSEMLRRIIPPHHRFVIDGPVLIVVPLSPAGEDWSEMLARAKISSPERLSMRFPGLNEPGVILSRGDDIQFVLRKIALGGKVPIKFPKDLHFPVFASFRYVPFFQILTHVVYVNQCIIIERHDGLEVTPWPRQILPRHPYPNYQFIQATPVEPQLGAGPKPPPVIPEHTYNYPFIRQNAD